MGRPIIPVAPKPCLQCGAIMERKRINGRLEDRAMYSRRKFCDQACMALALVKDAPSHRDTYHWRARRMRSESCEACGAMKSLQAHHVDQNPKNNSSDNIQTLCKSCHITHHHRARRAGKAVAGRMECRES